ncbi:MAG: RNA methyltransferase [Rhodocyclaceae bacterium]|nr:RNA methyltransferase [Rhodocyclaceae bacterium]
MQQITSRDNPLVKRVRALARSSREVKKQGLTLLDGDHLLRAALGAGRSVEQVLLSASGAGRHDYLALASAAGCPVTQLPDALFASVSPVESPSGILALMAVPASPAPAASGTVVVLDAVQDAGNLGTILRTAAAAAASQVWLTDGCAQAWSPKVLRAGMGAHFALEICEPVDAESRLVEFGGEVLATELGDGARSLYDCVLDEPLAWLFGNEGQGLRPALSALATQRVRIPMPGPVESLNVGAAVAICLFEQRRRCGDAR